jgi:DNA polymerase-3 subunit alpha
LEQALQSGQKVQQDAMMGQSSIFDMVGEGGGSNGGVARVHPAVSGDEWERDELLRREKEVLGLYVSSHPLTPIRAQLARQVDVPLGQVETLRDGQVVTVGGIVSSIRQLVTKRGDTMAFVELDDISGTVEVTVFAKTWAQAREVLRADAVVVVKGRVERRTESEVKLMAIEAAPFAASADFGVVKLRVDARLAPATVIQELKHLIGEYPGEAPVELRVETSAGAKVLRFGTDYRVKPDGDFMAEAKALLGEAALA